MHKIDNKNEVENDLVYSEGQRQLNRDRIEDLDTKQKPEL